MNLWFPRALAQVSPESRLQIERAVDLDQASRLIHALYAYPLLLIVLYKTTDIYRDHAQTMLIVTVTFLAVLLALAVVLAFSGRIHSREPASWRLLILLFVTLVALTAGALHALITLYYGTNCWTYSVSVIWMSGCTAGALSSFVPNFALRTIHLLSHLMPGLVMAWLFCGTNGRAAAMAFSILIAFSILQGARLQSAYWEQVVQRFRDTERARELEVAHREAEEANRAKSYFIANISHEIRTPMNGVMGMINLALETTSDSDRDECLNTARSSAEYLLNMLNEILDFSKIEAGKLVIQFADFDLAKLVSDAVAMFSIQAASKQLQLSFHIAEAVPRLVRGDVVRVRQVLVNLISNAMKFTERGSIGVFVNAATNDPQMVTFSVQDTGIGIPPDKQQIIFEAFTQADSSTTRRFGGTGLGLTISSRLVQAMSGQVWVESQPGLGSTFHFTVPFLTASSKAAANPLVMDRPHGKSVQVPLTILLVEDNLVNQKLGMRVLAKAGHRVTLAMNGREAVEKSAQQVFDCILMDLQMPEMDGLEATALIRERERRLGIHTPIVALTAHALPEHEQSCRAAGMDGYLTKPLDTEKLFEQLNQLVSREFAA